METFITVIISAVTTLGGWEMIKYFLNRKTNKRNAETESDSLEFGTLRDTVNFLQDQLRQKEERFAEQTELVRELNSENLELTKKLTALEMKCEYKICNVRNCAQREPQSGY